ncbi:uncharacterized protein LOC131245784 isoform X2 [Magnolia sinica]|uniref:uncharacterized protein LOC131245784 isoform X2 n=1 Tax=Magnolia sinica TaxID=86752 RepID=UPI002659E38E|nr:uncharacterized protein LOC131245784 isoform X2 [Magnolia sinica]
MLQDVIHPPEQLPIESLSSPISSVQILDFCDNVFFPESLRSSEVSSCSGGAGGCCYDDNSYTTDLSFSSFPPDVANFNDATISILLDSPLEAEPEIPTTLNFPSPFSIPPVITSNQHEQFDISSLQSQIPLTDVSNVNGFSPYSPDSVAALPAPQLLPSVFEEDCLCPTQSYGCLDPTSPSSPSFLDTSGMGAFFGGNMNLGIAMAAVEASGMFSGSLQCQELEFQGENGGVYSSESVYSSGELQVLNENQQQLVVSGSCSSTAPFSTEMSAFEDSTFKVGRLSVEERKEKIHRYLKKRNERNFSKKIKYACRKTLADSRPRVRGRFAKNDEFGEAVRPSCSHHEDDDEEEVRVKEEEEMMDSSDIFAHISGVNSFKCNYPIQSWM